MPVWKKTHSPDYYYASFHRPFKEGPGTYMIFSSLDEKEVRREGNRFNAFKWVLRSWTSHPTAQLAAEYDSRLAYELGADGVWMLHVTITKKKRLAAEIAQKVFNKDLSQMY